MIKKLIFLISIIFLLHTIQAQFVDEPVNKEKFNFKERIFTGGGLGLNFGTITMINISPLVGIRLTDKFATGVKFTFIHYKDKRFMPAISQNMIGGSVFFRRYIIKSFFAHAEYEYLKYKVYADNITYQTADIHSIFIGGGLMQPIGGQASLNLLVLWNINDTPDSPYTNPIFRIGITTGIF